MAEPINIRFRRFGSGRSVKAALPKGSPVPAVSVHEFPRGESGVYLGGTWVATCPTYEDAVVVARGLAVLVAVGNETDAPVYAGAKYERIPSLDYIRALIARRGE